MLITNLTQHDASESQIAAGVAAHPEQGALRLLLTIGTIDEAAPAALIERAERIAEMAAATGAQAAMIGGHLGLTASVAKALKARGITPLLSFSERRSVDEHLPDGKVIKRAVFEHIGFSEFPV